MSQAERVQIEEEITHLDFDPEKEEEKKEPGKMHYSHPTDPALFWCGEAKKRPGYTGKYRLPSKITCVDCLHLYIEKGRDWWWSVHHAWYGPEGAPRGRR